MYVVWSYIMDRGENYNMIKGGMWKQLVNNDYPGINEAVVHIIEQW